MVIVVTIVTDRADVNGKRQSDMGKGVTVATTVTVTSDSTDSCDSN